MIIGAIIVGALILELMILGDHISERCGGIFEDGAVIGASVIILLVIEICLVSVILENQSHRLLMFIVAIQS